MLRVPRRLVVIAMFAAALPATIAQAQYYSAGPQPYAVQAAPNTYMIERPTRGFPYVRGAEPTQQRFDRAPYRADRAVIEESRGRVPAKIIVREPPVVVETERVVDDPPRVIERRAVKDARAFERPTIIKGPGRGTPDGRVDNSRQLIHADAEITIFGEDSMSIRLFRKGSRGTVRVDGD